MNLYLMRHGIARDVGEQGITTDADRSLTGEGRRKVSLIAQGLLALGVGPARFVSSPLLRARQTAEIVARQLGDEPEVEIVPSLAPGGDVEEFLQWLRDESADSVLAVGHMPDLAVWTGRLLFGEARGPFNFKKGGVACLACEGAPRAGHFVLEWLMPPRAFRRLDLAD